MQLSEHLETNLAALNARLGSSADFYAKRIELYHIRGAILLFDGMASLESLWGLCVQRWSFCSLWRRCQRWGYPIVHRCVSRKPHFLRTV